MAFTFPTSPSAGDTFQHGGLEFVYRASPSRWAVNGYNGIPDPFAGYTQGSFTATSGLLGRTVARGSTAFPFRTGFQFGEDGSSGLRGGMGFDLGLAEQALIFPDVATQGLWYVSTETADANSRGTLIAMCSEDANTEIRAIVSGANELNIVGALDENDVRIDDNSGQGPTAINELGRGIDSSPSTIGGCGIGRGYLNGTQGTFPSTTDNWKSVRRLVASRAVTNDGDPLSLDILRGNTLIGTDAYGGEFYDSYWRITRTNVAQELGIT